MSPERSNRETPSRQNYWSIQAIDVVVTVAAFVLAFSLRTEFAFSDPDWLAMLVGIPVVAVVSLISFHVVGLFRGTWSETADADLIVVVKGTSLVSALLIAGMVLTNTLSEIPRSVPLIHWFITIVALYGSRMLWARIKRQAADSVGRKSVAILVGCNRPALRFLSSVQARTCGRLKIFGMLDDSRHLMRVGRTIRGIPVIGQVIRAEECLANLSVHGVYPDRFVVMDSFRQSKPVQFAKLQKLAERVNISVDIVDDGIWLDDHHDEQPDAVHADAKPALSVKGYMHWRRPLEWMVAVLMVTLLSPIFVLLAALCLIDVGRPIFFWQMRPGRNMKPIKLIKFRTMRSAFDTDGTPLSDEKRTSAIGRLIRRSKLDELPQLLSIISGDMSFIGPRPLLPRDLPADADLRAIVRPGVTGWAQVNGGHPLENEEKFALDIWYIQNASFWLDVRVLWRTLRTVLLGDRVDREAIDKAMATRQLLRAPAQDIKTPANQPVFDGPDGRNGGRPDQTWWPRPANTFDRAS